MPMETVMREDRYLKGRVLRGKESVGGAEGHGLPYNTAIYCTLSR